MVCNDSIERTDTRLMQTTLVAAKLQSRIRPVEGQLRLSLLLAVLRHIYVCNDVNMNLSRCLWFIKDGNDSIQGLLHFLYVDYTVGNKATESRTRMRPDEGQLSVELAVAVAVL